MDHSLSRRLAPAEECMERLALLPQQRVHAEHSQPPQQPPHHRVDDDYKVHAYAGITRYGATDLIFTAGTTPDPNRAALKLLRWRRCEHA